MTQEFDVEGDGMEPTIGNITAGITQETATAATVEWFDEPRWWPEEEESNTEYPEHFWAWLQLNPHLFGAFVEVARRLQNLGFKRYSAQGIICVLRFQSDVGELGRGTLQINNNAASGLARLAMSMYPELKGFFETRTRRETCAIQLDGTPYGERT
jgi:hypothetical protein